MNDINNNHIVYRKLKIHNSNILIGYLIVTSILIQTRMTKCQSLPPTDVAKITYFNNTEGLYYKFLGKLKVTDSDWKLINFLNLEHYTTKYMALFKLYNSTSQLCGEFRQKIENPENKHSCQQFAQSTIPYFHEIEQNHQNILSTIGNNDQPKNRNRRGLDTINYIF